MDRLRITNGKFYRNNTVVPIELGNREQIECLRAYETRMAEYDQGVEVEIQADTDEETGGFYLQIEFYCVCGQRIPLDLGTENRRYRHHITSVQCPFCGKEYTIDPVDNNTAIIRLSK